MTLSLHSEQSCILGPSCLGFQACIPHTPSIFCPHPPLLIGPPLQDSSDPLSPPQATGVPSQHILVAVLPGLPTAAELFVLPYQDPAGENRRSPEDLEQVSPQGVVFSFFLQCEPPN